jgi:DNA-3-methyladenine glycosylase
VRAHAAPPEPDLAAPPLPRDLLARGALAVARDLLGAVLVHEAGGVVRAGMIVETEAYVGPHDLACHAAKGRTARTDVMFGEAGHAYVYLVYGMHHCLNVVTGKDGVAAAVLLRGLAPLRGIGPGVRTDGPGCLTRALGVDLRHNRADLCAAGSLRLLRGARVPPRAVARGPRIGVAYAGTWADRPYRFWVRGHPNVSRPRG